MSSIERDVRGLWRPLLGAASATLLIVAGACSGDDDGAGPSDAGADGASDVTIPPPPDVDASKPPEGVDTTNLLGPPVTLADLGEPTDGPSWRVRDQALYFVTPYSDAGTLRRLHLDGGIVESVPYDGQKPGPFGTATGGGDRLFVTEPSAVSTIDFDADGGAVVTRHSGPALHPGGAVPLGQLGDVVVGTQADGGQHAYFVDLQAASVLRYDPSGSVMTVAGEAPDGGSLTAIAARSSGAGVEVYVGFSNLVPEIAPSRAMRFVPASSGLELERAGGIGAVNVPPNGLAVSDDGFFFVAWAQGIDVYSSDGSRVGSSPGLALSAIPTSVAFGGPDRKTLFVTTSAGKVYGIPAKVAGVLR